MVTSTSHRHPTASLAVQAAHWDDPAARESLVDALVRDAQAALAVLHGHELAGPVAEAHLGVDPDDE